MTTQRKERIATILNRRQPDLTIVMENVHDPHNISAVMRTCDAVGIQEIYVLNSQIEKHTRFGPRSSASAAGWLTIHQFEDTQACVAAIRSRYDKIFATHLAEKASSLYELNLTERVALVFGNEHDGVSEALLQLCDGNFIIPQVGMVKSLNISVACAVSLYEAYRQREQKDLYNGVSRMPKEQYDALAEKWGLTKEQHE